MVFSCQTIVFMHDPTIEAFLRITESCTGVNSSLWLRWSTVNSDRARRVMFSNARSSCLVDKVIKQKRQRALILLVFVRFWNSSTSIKLWSWSDAKTAASCGFSSWCKSDDQQLCSFSVCLAVCSHLASLECYCRAVRSSLIPTMSVIQKVRGNVRKYRVSFFFSVNPTSGCLDVGRWAGSGSLCSWAQDAKHPLFQWERAVSMHHGKAQICSHVANMEVYETPLIKGRSHFSLTDWEIKSVVGVTSCRLRELLFYSSAAAYGFLVNLCVGPRSTTEILYTSVISE